MGPYFSPRGRSRDRSRFGPGCVPGPNSDSTECSVPMGTQVQRLTTPRAWDPEAVQVDSARNLKAHHFVSQARLQLPSGFRKPLRMGAYRQECPWPPKRDPDRHRPLSPQLTLRGDHCTAVGWAPGACRYPTLTLTQPLSGTLARNLSLPRYLILHLSCRLAWALTSALEGDHETGVASALATSLARTLTLAKALPSWGPNSNV